MERLIKELVLYLGCFLLMVLGSILNAGILLNTNNLNILVTVSVLYGILFITLVYSAIDIFWHIVCEDENATD